MRNGEGKWKGKVVGGRGWIWRRKGEWEWNGKYEISGGGVAVRGGWRQQRKNILGDAFYPTSSYIMHHFIVCF